MKRIALILTLLAAATSAGADVIRAEEAGFALRKTVTVAATPDEAFAMLGKPALWWNADHSYSGNARNMTMKLRPGGCFCESIPKGKGQIEHGRVLYIMPGKTLRLSAALGPLQAEGLTGTLTWSIKSTASGTEITQDYVVGGFSRISLKTLAPLVDGVMSDQLDRLAAQLK